MNDDDLRRRLTATDPMSAAVPVTSIDDPGARALLEDIMNTPTDTTTDTPTTHRTSGAAPTSPDRNRWFAPIAGIAAVGALVVGGLAVGGAFDAADDEPDVAGEITVDGDATDGAATDEPAVVLSLGEGQDAMASCLRVDAEVLRPVALAFAGDVTSIDDETVVLQVTTWYTGGDAPTVQLEAPAGLEALIGTVDFEVGGSYLVSSGDGSTVNYCGWSDRESPELRQIYDEAFAG